MIQEVATDIAILLTFTSAGAAFAVVYRLMRVIAKASGKRAAIIASDAFAGLTAGAVFILTADAFGGRIAFVSIAVYVFAALAFVKFMSDAEIPNEEKLAAAFAALSAFFKKLTARIKENRVPKENNGNPVRHIFGKRVTTSRADNASRIRRDRRLWFLRGSSRRRDRNAS